ncbi:MAG: hypothetical protein Q9161_007210 [Pseudevernia consocians]
MALGDFRDVESSTKIPDDIFQAALAASLHGSDEEDPYEPQPKRFMQTETQKRRQKRNLQIRRVAWTMRKMMKTYKAKHQPLMKQKKRSSPFEKLPSDLVLKLMQHTNLSNVHNLINSSAINKNIFKANEKSVFRGMEIEQFPEWKWLFGDSKQRTLAQSQHLKEATLSELSEECFYNPGDHGWAYDKQVLNVLQRIDNNEFTGVRNLEFLQHMQDRLDVDIDLTESFTKMKIARRTAICLRSLGFQRPAIVNEENRTEYGPLINAARIPWEARSQLVNEQPASTRAEIQSVLKIVVETLSHRVQELVNCWIWWYHRTPDNDREPQAVKKWMSKLVTGLILEKVVPQWRAENTGSFSAPRFAWHHSCLYLAQDLGVLFNKHNEGNVDAAREVKDGVEFGKSIGMNLELLLDGIEIVGLDGDE